MGRRCGFGPFLTSSLVAVLLFQVIYALWGIFSPSDPPCVAARHVVMPQSLPFSAFLVFPNESVRRAQGNVTVGGIPEDKDVQVRRLSAGEEIFRLDGVPVRTTGACYAVYGTDGYEGAILYGELWRYGEHYVHGFDSEGRWMPETSPSRNGPVSAGTGIVRLVGLPGELRIMALFPFDESIAAALESGRLALNVPPVGEIPAEAMVWRKCTDEFLLAYLSSPWIPPALLTDRRISGTVDTENAVGIMIPDRFYMLRDGEYLCRIKREGTGGWVRISGTQVQGGFLAEPGPVRDGDLLYQIMP